MTCHANFLPIFDSQGLPKSDEKKAESLRRKRMPGASAVVGRVVQTGRGLTIDQLPQTAIAAKPAAMPVRVGRM